MLTFKRKIEPKVLGGLEGLSATSRLDARSWARVFPMVLVLLPAKILLDVGGMQSDQPKGRVNPNGPTTPPLQAFFTSSACAPAAAVQSCCCGWPPLTKLSYLEIWLSYFEYHISACVLFSTRSNFQAWLLIGTRLFFPPGVSIGSLGEREAEAIRHLFCFKARDDMKWCTKGRLHTLNIAWYMMLIDRQFWYDEGVFVISLLPRICWFSGRWLCFVKEQSAFGTHLFLHRDGWGKNTQWRYLSMMLFVKWKKRKWHCADLVNRIRRSGSYLHLRILHLFLHVWSDFQDMKLNGNTLALRIIEGTPFSWKDRRLQLFGCQSPQKSIYRVLPSSSFIGHEPLAVLVTPYVLDKFQFLSPISFRSFRLSLSLSWIQKHWNCFTKTTFNSPWLQNFTRHAGEAGGLTNKPRVVWRIVRSRFRASFLKHRKKLDKFCVKEKHHRTMHLNKSTCNKNMLVILLF